MLRYTQERTRGLVNKKIIRIPWRQSLFKELRARCVYKHLCVYQREKEMSRDHRSMDKASQQGLGRGNGFTIKPQVTMFLEVIGPA
jgi:hypothetical protein